MDLELKEMDGDGDGKAADVKGESEREHRPLLKSESMISSSMNGEAEARSSSLHDPGPGPGPDHDPDPGPGHDPHPDPDLEKKYAAFVRCDSYGPMGRGDVSLKEKLLLALALLTLVPLRILLGLAIVCSYYLICRSLTLFSILNNILLDRDRGAEEEQQEDYAHILGWRRSLIVMSGRFFSRSLLFVFGFYSIPHRYHYHGPPRPVSHEHIDEVGSVPFFDPPSSFVYL